MIPFKDFSREAHNIPISFEQAKHIIDTACTGVREKGYANNWSRMPDSAKRRCQKVIFEHLLDVAAKMKFKYISLATSKTGFSSSELLGDGSEINGWPKVWRLSQKMGIDAGCGNSNQHQIHFIYFSSEHEGKWDIATRTRIGEPDRLVTKERVRG